MDCSESVLPFDKWTSCEMYGHLMVQTDHNSKLYRCSDCGEEYEDVSENSGG